MITQIVTFMRCRAISRKDAKKDDAMLSHALQTRQKMFDENKRRSAAQRVAARGCNDKRKR